MGRTLFYYIFHHYTRTNTISTFSSLSFIFSCVNAQSSTALGWMFWMPGSKDNTSHYTITGSMKAYDLSSNSVKRQAGKGRLAKGCMLFYHALCRKRKHESKDNTNGKTTLQIKIPKKEQSKRKPSFFDFVTSTDSNSYKTACKRACFTM